MNYEPIVTVNQEVANAPAPDGLTLDEKIEFVQVDASGEGAFVRWVMCQLWGKIWRVAFSELLVQDKERNLWKEMTFFWTHNPVKKQDMVYI